ncbi:uncharacterized protein LOC128205058 [Mya arenaria]|uniref:uncharacterized protein LOC128205058 n=1 Tax=Mya arenaria TaxID=6604 RepID=UPI0022E148D1|nr:uncharacterized protein LOC128205058 [Mya arenaria]
MSGRRIRTLTYKAMEIYEQTVLDMDKSYRRALDSLVALFDTDCQQIIISKLEQELSIKHEDFECIYKQYSEYLSKTNSKDSLDKLQKLSASHTQCIRDLTIFKDKVTEVKQSYDLRVFSPSKPSSMRSSSSAKARAALARLQYAEKDAELRKQQSRLEERQAVNAAALEREQRDLKTELELLSEQRIVAEIQAEENDDNISCSSHIPNEPQRQIDTFLKDTITHVEDPVEKPVPIHNDLTRLFLRKELLISRITYFDGKTENFQAWKNTFESVCNEIGVSPVEELDLLVKWLGAESRKFATSIRSAYSHDAAIGLQRVWERLNEQYGAIEKVHQSVLGKLDKFPPISPKDPSKLYELSDVLSEIEALKTNPKYSPALSYFDTSVGVAPIVNRLPRNIQEKWISTASHFKTVHDLMYPPFSEFVVFVRKQARIRNDPSFASSANDSNHAVFVRDTKSASQNGYRKPRISTSKTEIQPPCYDTASKIECSLHKTTSHSLENCRTFISKTFAEKRRLLKDNKLCFKCFGVDHVSKDCNKNIVCGKCDKAHNTVMHIDTNRFHGGERTFENTTNATNQVNSKCTQICGKQGFSGKSCAKIVLVDTYAKGCESNKIRAYAIIDDQSNRSLVSPQLLDSLKLDSQMVEYSVTSCNGVRVTSGRMASGLMIESLNGDVDFEMSSVFECDAIPNNRQEIPTPEVAAHYAHLQDLREDIPVLDRSAEIQILIGRDLIEAHHVHEQKISSTRNMPYAQKLALGWVIVGETCLGNLNSEDLPSLNVNKTLIVNEGRNSILSPCTNSFRLEEQYRPFSESCPDTESDIFKREKQDERPGLSREDREFNQLMEESFVKGPSGNWTAPLPFKSNRKKLPSNKGLAVRRAQLLDTSLKKNPTKKQHFVDFMENILEKGHAEEAPPLLPGEEHLYLPIFGVYHPKKVDQIRVVFDSSAKYEGVSLNDLLLSGPDLTNSLLGVLLRFRKEAIAVTADIQQMFYCFNVHESHRNFLRFLWYKDNDTTKNLTEYRMKVHVFGNKPSPSVASYGLRKTAEISTEEFGEEVTNYILNSMLMTV